MNRVLFIVMIVLLGACRSEDKLEQVLRYSGGNRAELEAVIRHYSQREEDSLQLRAARFLIENMPGHYAPDAPVIRKFEARMDSLYPRMSNVLKRPVCNLPLRLLGDRQGWTTVQDVHVMTKDYLVKYVDNAVRMWKECSWMRLFSFDDFCEYVLPYRVANEPILEEDSTWYTWQTVVRRFDEYGYEPKTLMEYKTLQRDLLGHADDDSYMKRLHVALPGKEFYSFDCLDRCYYEVSRLRSVGIPCAVDFVPGWPYRNGKHYWRVMREPYYGNENQSEALNSEVGKIYRMTYSHNQIPVPAEGESVPRLFRSPFYRDVTREYVKVSEVAVDVEGVAARNAYLCIFNDLEWKPVAWAEIDEGTARFEDMGRNVVYLPVCFEKGRMKNVGFPFLLDMQGRIKEFVSDGMKKISLNFTRKFPVNEAKIIWAEDLKGVWVEASNRPDFLVTDTLYVFRQTNTALNFQTISLDSPAAYRYWRMSKADKYLSIGEWELFDEAGTKLEPSSFLSYQQEDGTVHEAFDGNVLTHTSSSRWFGADMGKPVKVGSMRVVTRTDDNGITPGHDYALYYYSCRGWALAGSKEAVDDHVSFEAVPEGALYWLRDLTAGKEERIFTFEHGRIRYW